jgi:PAS domain S-box-containing protein
VSRGQLSQGSPGTLQLNPRVSRKLDQFVAFSSLFSIAVGLAGLAGWIFQIEILRRVFPGLVAMKVNTAASFLLIGLALWWMGRHDRSSPVSNWIAKAAAAIVTAVGLLSFLEFLGGWNFGIDQLFFVETAEGAIGSIRPGLMSPVTALTFMLLGLALLLLDWSVDREVSPAQSLASGAGLISLFALLDFMVQPHGSHAGMALQTAISQSLLSMGVVCCRPERGFVGMLLRANFRSGTVRGLWAAVLWDDGPSWRRPLRYGLTVLLVFLATVLRYIPGGFLPEKLTYITYFPAVMFAAIVGGLGSGILATLLSDVCADYFFLEPKGQFGNLSLPDLTGLIIFTLVGIGMSWLAGAIERVRMSAAAALRASENRYRTLIENLPQMVFVKDRASVYVSCNQSFARSLGIRPEEYAGKTDYDFFPAEMAEKYRSDDQRVMESGTTEEIEEKYIRDGKELSVQTVKTPIRDAAGNVTGILGIFWDITERKRVQEQLRQSSLYARSLLEASLDPLVTISREGKITDVNEAAEKVTGASREKLIGSDFSSYFTDPESARRGYEQVFSQGSVQNYALAIRHASGKITDVLYNATVFKNEAGEIEGVFAAARDITEKKRAQEAVAAEREKFNNILDVLPPYLVLLTPDYHVAFANREFTRRFGESHGRRCFEFLFNRSEPCEICETYKVLQTKKPLEWKWTGPDGRHYDIYDFPFIETDGSTLILEMGIDVTERRQAEDTVRKASLYARSLLEASLDPLVTISREGKITDVNEATEKVTGVSRERLIGSDFSNYFTEPEQARCGYEEVFAKGFVHDYPLAIRSAAGKVTDVLYNASVFKNEAGEVEGVFAAARDVTQRKRAEEEIRKLNQELEGRVQQRTAQLHESERRVRRKLESILSPTGDLGNLDLADILDIPAVQSMVEDFYKLAGVPLFILDLKSTVLVSMGWQEICTKFHRAHPEACKNCQESDRELSTGVVPGEFKLYKCKNNLWDVVTPIIVGGQQVGNLFSGQFFFTDEPVDYALFRAQAKKYGFDEQEYLAALERVPRLSREAVNTGMAFYIKLAQLLSQLSYSGIKLARSMAETGRANEELAASVKEMEAFTYSVSHDLRAPLRHISGFSKILAEEYGSSLVPEAQHHLQRIQEGTRRMGLLVDDLLNLARVGRRDLSVQVAGMKSIVDEVIADLAPQCEGRQIEWKIGSLPFAECDPGLMKQVFQNLLSNAVKFTQPRSRAIIEVGQKDQEGTPVVLVRDNGVGFNMKYADKLFGVFQRLHRPEDFEGTGVGLATVQRIIQKHGGRIWAEAELDKGATFYFTLGASEKTQPQTKAATAAGDTA